MTMNFIKSFSGVFSISRRRETRMILNRLLSVSLAVLFVVTVVGCGKDDNGDAGIQLSAQELIERGWDNFENMEYPAALRDFKSAIDQHTILFDAWNGAGWSAGKQNAMLDDANEYFAGCLLRDTTRYDALGGWAFVVYQSGDWNGALNKADSLLHRRPLWRFLHQSDIDFHDLRLMMAAAYYNIGDFATSLNVITTYFNQSFEADIETPGGRRELLEEIERLRQIYG